MPSSMSIPSRSPAVKVEAIGGKDVRASHAVGRPRASTVALWYTAATAW